MIFPIGDGVLEIVTNILHPAEVSDATPANHLEVRRSFPVNA